MSRCSMKDKCGIIIVACSICFALILFLSAPAYADTATGYRGINPAPQIDIRDVINVQGPDNTQPVASVPEEPLWEGTNAVDAAAVDFDDTDTSLNQASIFAVVTKAGPYLHTYQGCNRYGGYSLDEAYTMSIPNLVSGSQAPPSSGTQQCPKMG